MTPRKNPQDRHEPLPSLSPAEWEVMKVIWDGGEMAARDVVAAMPPERGWAPKTVKTMLSRLVAKGALDYVQVGNSYLYRAVAPREAMTRKEVEDVLDRVSLESAEPLLAGFVRGAELNEVEIDRLRELLDEKERELSRRAEGDDA